jgi:trimethylamine:corrinoid methyltransferase-like protein
MYERARRRACDLLDDHQPPALDDDVKEQMRAVVERVDRERGVATNTGV